MVTVRSDTRVIAWTGMKIERKAGAAHAGELSEMEDDAALVLAQHANGEEQVRRDKSHDERSRDHGCNLDRLAATSSPGRSNLAKSAAAIVSAQFTDRSEAQGTAQRRGTR